MTHPLDDLTLESILTGRAYADIDGSALQRAICRLVDAGAVDDLLTAEERKQFFGCEDIPPLTSLVLVVLICGVRGGKTLLACCAAIRGALRADMSHLKHHEVARFPIIAPKKETAAPTFRMLRGIIE